MPDTFIRAAVAPASLNEDARTVDVVWSTGAPVSRRDAAGPYIECLSMAPEHVDLSRLNGASVLDTHRQGSLSNVLGTVRSASVDGRQGIATIQFSARPDVQPVWDDVRAGILRHVSVGYAVHEWRDSKDAKGSRVRTAVRWTPQEISLVPVPADPAATVRGNPMSEVASDTNAGAVDNDEVPMASRAAINQQIRAVVAVAKLPHTFADTLIDAGATVEQARAAAFEEMAKRSTPQLRTEAVRVDHVNSNDNPTAVRSAMADALAARLAPGLVKPEGRAREFMGYRTLDMVAELAAVRGDRFNVRDQNAVIERAMHTSSDFPLLLQDAGNKILLAQYGAAEPTYRKWAARKSFGDFKAHKFLRVGDFPAYQKLNEAGEVRYGTMSENREQVSADEYATGIIIGRRALMNDDLSALSDFSSMIAIRTAADENRMVYAALAANPVLSDSKALFHASHGNLAGSGTAIDTANFGKAVAALRKQKSLDGIPLNVAPRFLVVGPDKELEGRQLLAAIVANQTSSVNPWSGLAELIVDANVSGNAWYVFGEPALVPTVVYGYVAGGDGPQIKTEIDFDTQAVKVRSGLDFGCGVIDFRGGYSNPGN